MSEQNLGRRVKWQDHEGGWHTGRVVTSPARLGYPKMEMTMRHIIRGHDATINAGDETLIRESCDGRLSWVNKLKLQDWTMRHEFEDADGNMLAGSSY